MGGEGAAAGYNGFAAHPGYLLQQKLKHSRPWAFACSRFLSCSASCTTHLMLFYLQQLLFVHGSGSAELCRENLLLLVIPDRCKQYITASYQGEVSLRFAFYNWKALCSKSLSYCEKICVSLRGNIWKASNNESSP